MFHFIFLALSSVIIQWHITFPSFEIYNTSIEWVIFVLKTSTISSRASQFLVIKLFLFELLIYESLPFLQLLVLIDTHLSTMWQVIKAILLYFERLHEVLHLLQGLQVHFVLFCICTVLARE